MKNSSSSGNDTEKSGPCSLTSGSWRTGGEILFPACEQEMNGEVPPLVGVLEMTMEGMIVRLAHPILKNHLDTSGRRKGVVD